MGCTVRWHRAHCRICLCQVQVALMLPGQLALKLPLALPISFDQTKMLALISCMRRSSCY